MQSPPSADCTMKVQQITKKKSPTNGPAGSGCQGSVVACATYKQETVGSIPHWAELCSDVVLLGKALCRLVHSLDPRVSWYLGNGYLLTISHKTDLHCYVPERTYKVGRLTSYHDINPAFGQEMVQSCMTSVVENLHTVTKMKYPTSTVPDHARSFGKAVHESNNRMCACRHTDHGLLKTTPTQHHTILCQLLL